MMDTERSSHIGGAPVAFSQAPQAHINNYAALTLRWLLLAVSIAMAAPASAKTETQAVTTLTNTAANYLAMGALDQAANALERALRIEPHNPILWHFLAQTHHQRGDYEQARDMAEKSSSLAGDDAALKAQNTWLTALTDQASIRRGAPSNEAARIEELLNEKCQANQLSKQELMALKRELDSERARSKQFLETVTKRAPRTESNELKQLSSKLEQESAKRRETEAALAVAEKKSHRFSQQLNVARADLEAANRQLAAAQQQYRQTETVLKKPWRETQGSKSSSARRQPRHHPWTSRQKSWPRFARIWQQSTNTALIWRKKLAFIAIGSKGRNENCAVSAAPWQVWNASSTERFTGKIAPCWVRAAIIGHGGRNDAYVISGAMTTMIEWPLGAVSKQFPDYHRVSVIPQGDSANGNGNVFNVLSMPDVTSQ